MMEDNYIPYIGEDWLPDEHTSPVFVMLVGLPGSGKSTWRRVLGDNFLILSTDDYVERVAEREHTTYSAVWERVIGAANKNMHDNFRAALERGQSIVWDQTNLTLKKRRSVLSQIPRHYQKVAVYFEIPESERQCRILSRPGKCIPDDVDRSMRDNYERPTRDEGFDVVVAGGQAV